MNGISVRYRHLLCQQYSKLNLLYIPNWNYFVYPIRNNCPEIVRKLSILNKWSNSGQSYVREMSQNATVSDVRVLSRI